MPRQDRTFTDKDIVRLIENNLDNQEQTKVLIALCRGIKIEVFDDIAILVPEFAAAEAIEETDIVNLIIDLLLTAVF